MWRGLIFMLVLASCSSGNIKPKAAGDMYDVVVAADNKEAEQTIKDMLETPMEGLPQSEPWFKVMTTGTTTLTNATKYAKAIVIVKTSDKTRIRYEYDAFAHGQTIVYITCPTAEALRKDSAQIASKLLALLDKAEIKAATYELTKRNNKEASKLIEKTIGCTMLVPEDISSSKTGKDFVWLSNNATRALRNICVYSYPVTTLNSDIAIAMRDSIMAKNIEGEESGMYMQTERNIEPSVTLGNGTLTMRGLWVMKGDAMGGPFVSISTIDSAKRRTIVAEGFVYAPESRKKILIKQLEAAISTLKLHSK